MNKNSLESKLQVCSLCSIRILSKTRDIEQSVQMIEKIAKNENQMLWIRPCPMLRNQRKVTINQKCELTRLPIQRIRLRAGKGSRLVVKNIFYFKFSLKSCEKNSRHIFLRIFFLIETNWPLDKAVLKTTSEKKRSVNVKKSVLLKAVRSSEKKNQNWLIFQYRVKESTTRNENTKRRTSSKETKRIKR